MSPIAVFRAFLKLGLTSFGGPIAHIGYFRNEFVARRAWLSDEDFAQLLALCQFLPGPASSQLGFAIGLVKAGWLGALAAFVAFTLPSALLLFAFATLLPQLSGVIADAALHGLKLVALVVVAHGVVGMWRQLCPDLTRAAIAVVAAGLILLTQGALFQLAAIAVGGGAGWVFCRTVKPLDGGRLRTRHGVSVGYVLLGGFFVLLLGLPLFSGAGSPLLSVADAFYRAGALVFGGGHVVLPLLEETVVEPGWVSQGDFLAGYGAAQAVPGPMFTLASYLGALLPDGTGGMLGSVTATLAIFLPGFLLLAGILPVWSRVSALPVAARVIAGVNAAVVGLLAAALYDPVFTSAARGWADIVIALLGFGVYLRWNVSALWIVAWCVLASIVASMLGAGA